MKSRAVSSNEAETTKPGYTSRFAPRLMTSCTPARERTPVSVNPAASRHFAQAEATEKKKKKKEEESTDVRLLYFAPLRLIYGLPCRFIEGCRLRNERHWYTSPRKCRRPSPPSPPPPLDSRSRDRKMNRWTRGISSPFSEEGIPRISCKFRGKIRAAPLSRLLPMNYASVKRFTRGSSARGGHRESANVVKVVRTATILRRRCLLHVFRDATSRFHAYRFFCFWMRNVRRGCIHISIVGEHRRRYPSRIII